MTDFLSPSERRSLMSRVRGKNTRIELLMFAELEKRGIRFSTHAPGLDGHPDIFIDTCSLLVFLDGDFWHGRNYDSWQHKLTPFWRAKIERNIERDRRQRARLRRQGWHVLRLWGSDILKDSEKCVQKILRKASREDGAHQSS
jgi:DNA mismatch endonuclease, patch repair protein